MTKTIKIKTYTLRQAVELAFRVSCRNYRQRCQMNMLQINLRYDRPIDQANDLIPELQHVCQLWVDGITFQFLKDQYIPLHFFSRLIRNGISPFCNPITYAKKVLNKMKIKEDDLEEVTILDPIYFHEIFYIPLGISGIEFLNLIFRKYENPFNVKDFKRFKWNLEDLKILGVDKTYLKNRLNIISPKKMNSVVKILGLTRENLLEIGFHKTFIEQISF